LLRRSDALNGPLGARKKKNSRSRLESSILRPMQKTPTAGGGGLKGSKKNAKVTKKVWNMRFDVFSETDLQLRNAHVR
jgi:hypothetical protein